MQESDTLQLVPDDSVTEALETDNLSLQNMSGSKYVQVMIAFALHCCCCKTMVKGSVGSSKTLHLQANPVFLEKVTNWQRKLGTVDIVLSTWSLVQKKWQALVSIFLGSADIREQLPEDSQRFDSINVEFKVSCTCCMLLRGHV